MTEPDAPSQRPVVIAWGVVLGLAMVVGIVMVASNGSTSEASLAAVVTPTPIPTVTVFATPEPAPTVYVTSAPVMAPDPPPAQVDEEGVKRNRVNCYQSLASTAYSNVPGRWTSPCTQGFPAADPGSFISREYAFYQRFIALYPEYQSQPARDVAEMGWLTCGASVNSGRDRGDLASQTSGGNAQLSLAVTNTALDVMCPEAENQVPVTAPTDDGTNYGA